MKNKLADIRQKLDETDQKIVEALAKRQQLVREVSDLKIDQTKDIRDEEREDQLLQRITKLARKAGVDRYFAVQIFRDIIDHSVRFQTQTLVDNHNHDKLQDMVKVAYQGTNGAFSHQAAFRHFEERYKKVVCIGFDTFRQAAEAVENEEADYGILPIENTTAGSINDTYDILGQQRLHIIGEEAIRVVHCLLAIEPVSIEHIKRVISHPQALAQCSQFLSGLQRCKVESYLDTAMAAKKVLEDDDISQAAIAGRYAAELYGLHVLKEDIANQTENFTRFVVVSRDKVKVDAQIPCKTSLLMTTSHDKGSLISCLMVLEDHSINMAKLESRPKPHAPWAYRFYIDLEANIDDPGVSTAISELQSKAESLSILGSYPAHVGNG